LAGADGGALLDAEDQLAVLDFRGEQGQQVVVGRDRQRLGLALLDDEPSAAAERDGLEVAHQACLRGHGARTAYRLERAPGSQHGEGRRKAEESSHRVSSSVGGQRSFEWLFVEQAPSLLSGRKPLREPQPTPRTCELLHPTTNRRTSTCLVVST